MDFDLSDELLLSSSLQHKRPRVEGREAPMISSNGEAAAMTQSKENHVPSQAVTASSSQMPAQVIQSQASSQPKNAAPQQASARSTSLSQSKEEISKLANEVMVEEMLMAELEIISTLLPPYLPSEKDFGKSAQGPSKTKAQAAQPSASSNTSSVRGTTPIPAKAQASPMEQAKAPSKSPALPQGDKSPATVISKPPAAAQDNANTAKPTIPQQAPAQVQSQAPAQSQAVRPQASVQPQVQAPAQPQVQALSQSQAPDQPQVQAPAQPQVQARPLTAAPHQQAKALAQRPLSASSLGPSLPQTPVRPSAARPASQKSQVSSAAVSLASSPRPAPPSHPVRPPVNPSEPLASAPGKLPQPAIPAPPVSAPAVTPTPAPVQPSPAPVQAPPVSVQPSPAPIKISVAPAKATPAPVQASSSSMSSVQPVAKQGASPFMKPLLDEIVQKQREQQDYLSKAHNLGIEIATLIRQIPQLQGLPSTPVSPSISTSVVAELISPMPNSSLGLPLSPSITVRHRILPGKPRAAVLVDADEMITMTMEGTVHFWAVSQPEKRHIRQTKDLSLGGQSVESVCWLPNAGDDEKGILLSALSSNIFGDNHKNLFSLMRLSTGQSFLMPNRNPNNKAAEASVVAPSTSPKVFFAGHADKAVGMWEIKTLEDLVYKPIHTRHTSTIHSIVEHNGQLWSGGADCRLVCWDLRENVLRDDFKQADRINSLHFNPISQPNNVLVYSASQRSQIQVLDLRQPSVAPLTLSTKQEWAKRPSRYSHPAWHSEGNLVALGNGSDSPTRNGDISLWDLRYLNRGGHPAQVIETLDRRYINCDFHPTARLLVATAADGTVSFIDY